MKKNMILNIDKLAQSERIAIMEVAVDIGSSFAHNGIEITAHLDKINGFEIKKNGKFCHIIYDKISQLLRAIAILSTTELEIFDHKQKLQCEDLGIMVDNSRNAVLNLPSAKTLIRKIALLGLTSLQLYTEDTYEVESQPFFGYMRGRFSGVEIQELDCYANMLGIELVPCIQTLAHLNGLTHWQPYQEMIDTGDILLADNDKTYILIEDMLKSLSRNFSSRNINLGMDEAHLIGAGQYFHEHGYVPKYEILHKHLLRVLELCDKYGFKAKIWSDMFFRNWFKGSYYVENKTLPVGALEQVPNNVQLIYWDYYHSDPHIYRGMLDLHKQLTDKVCFAGGAWKWSGFAPLTTLSLVNTEAGLSEAIGNVQDVLITAWGDNGAECSAFSVLPIVAFYAQKCYGASRSETDKLFERITDISFNDFVKLEQANKIGTESGDIETNCSSKYFLYNDLFYGLFDSNVDCDTAKYFSQNAKTLHEIASSESEFSYLFDTLSALCEAVEIKVDMGLEISRLYKANDKAGLLNLSKRFDLLITKLQKFYQLFSVQWLKENKAFGLEIQNYRIGGLIARIEFCKARLTDYSVGTISVIEELEETKLDFLGKENFSKDKNILYNNFAFIASANNF